MKWISCVLFALSLQSVIPVSNAKRVSMEFNSFYFYKGVWNDFFEGRTESLIEIQKKYPGLRWEFVLIQLKSEPGFLAPKRLVMLKKRFTAAGLDMNRIVFNSKAFFVENLHNHVPPKSITALDTVGAILEGKVLTID